MFTMETRSTLGFYSTSLHHGNRKLMDCDVQARGRNRVTPRPQLVAITRLPFSPCVTAVTSCDSSYMSTPLCFRFCFLAISAYERPLISLDKQRTPLSQKESFSIARLLHTPFPSTLQIHHSRDIIKLKETPRKLLERNAQTQYHDF